MSSTLNIINLINVLLGLINKFGIKIVNDTLNLIRGLPMFEGETEADYINRLNAQITVNLDQAEAQDASVKQQPPE